MRKKCVVILIIILVINFLLSNEVLASYLNGWTKKDIEGMTTGELSQVYDVLTADSSEPKDKEQLKKYEEVANAYLKNDLRPSSTYPDKDVEEQLKKYKAKINGGGNTGGNESGGNGDLEGWDNWQSVPLDVYINCSEEEAYRLYELLKNPQNSIDAMNSKMLEEYVYKIDALIHSEGLAAFIAHHDGFNDLIDELGEIYQAIAENEKAMEKIKGTQAEKIIKDSPGADVDASGKEIKDSPIYHLPSQTEKDSGDGAEKSLEDMISDADKFLNKGEINIEQDALSNFSKTIYNILLAVGVVVAVIIGALIGIELMTSSAEGKAEAKELLIPYVVGCVVVFGGFAIWKIVVTILQHI